MSKLSAPIQTMIFSALDGNITASVFDHVPALPEGLPRDQFPFAVVSEFESAAWDTDDTRGEQGDLTIHIWSTYRGSIEVKNIMAEIYDILNRGTLTGVGVRVVDCLFSGATVFVEPDGITRHGVCRFTLTAEQE